jgi:hypothetical protein
MSNAKIEKKINFIKINIKKKKSKLELTWLICYMRYKIRITSQKKMKQITKPKV